MNGLLASGGAGGMFSIILVYAVLIGGMWFFLFRPQRKEQKRIQAMVASMEVGDTVLTTSGFYGVLIDITDDDVIVEFGNNRNCRIPMQKICNYSSRKSKRRILEYLSFWTESCLEWKVFLLRKDV